MGTETKQPRVLIVKGPGTNTENEAANLYRLAGAQPIQSRGYDWVHVNDLTPKAFEKAQIIEFPGGFVDGDYVNAAVMHAERMKARFGAELLKFVSDGKLIRGTCNGFQFLVKIGLLPGFDGNYAQQTVTLANNDSGKFEYRWVSLAVEPSVCKWIPKEIESPLLFPSRHGEGKLRVGNDIEKTAEELKRLVRDRMAVFRYATRAGEPTSEYPLNPNNADGALAGITNPTGTILGMMPHPEQIWDLRKLPGYKRLRREGKLPRVAPGLAVTKPAVDYAREISYQSEMATA